MLDNRSMPHSTVIPVLGYPDLAPAVSWLGQAFGFRERVRIGEHRAQLRIGSGDLVVASSGRDASLMVRVADIDSHHRRAVQAGARVLRSPERLPFGEVQYTVQDFLGYVWTFSESVADMDPAEWGGLVVDE